ncbi:hypothetical protein MRB53_038219 [Persea americana]|nr:hypothetical protein MRB53_038219 [Persea americana]
MRQNAQEAAVHNPHSEVSNLAPEKVHIRGLDNLTTNDIRLFASTHFPAADAKIEWIDDTSANIVYTSPALATPALAAFQLESSSDAHFLDLRHAKALPDHPSTILTVRSALATDVKAPHAHEASRFYLLHPDKDPRERRGREDGRKGYRRNDRGGTKRRREEEEEEDNTPFDVNLYDDDPTSLAARITKLGAPRPVRQARNGNASDDERRQKRNRRAGTARHEDLFASRNVGRLAEDDKIGRLPSRSASPDRLRDGDGRQGFSEATNGGSKSRAGATSVNSGKELLATKTAVRGAGSKDLFASKMSTAKLDEPVDSSPRKDGVLQTRIDARVPLTLMMEPATCSKVV